MNTLKALTITATIAAASLTNSTLSNAAGDFSDLPVVTETVNIGGQNTTISVKPEFQVAGGAGYINLGVKADLDISSLQSELPAQVNGTHKYDECGTRFYIKDAQLMPGADGKASISATAQVQQWECVKFDRPKLKYKYIRVFGKRVKIPDGIEMVRKVIKTKLVSQSATIQANVWPTIDGGSVKANVTITNLKTSGLSGKLVKAFGLKGKVIKLAQKEVDKALAEDGQFVLPPQFAEYDVKVHQADFIDIGAGRLGMRVNAAGTVTQEQIAKLVTDKLVN